MNVFDWILVIVIPLELIFVLIQVLKSFFSLQNNRVEAVLPI